MYCLWCRFSRIYLIPSKIFRYDREFVRPYIKRLKINPRKLYPPISATLNPPMEAVTWCWLPAPGAGIVLRPLLQVLCIAREIFHGNVYYVKNRCRMFREEEGALFSLLIISFEILRPKNICVRDNHPHATPLCPENIWPLGGCLSSPLNTSLFPQDPGLLYYKQAMRFCGKIMTHLVLIC